MSAAKPQKMFDVRTVEWYLSKEKLKSTEYERYLKSLPDVAEKGVTIGAELEPVTFFRKLVADGKARLKEEPEDDM